MISIELQSELKPRVALIGFFPNASVAVVRSIEDKECDERQALNVVYKKPLPVDLNEKTVFLLVLIFDNVALSVLDFDKYPNNIAK